MVRNTRFFVVLLLSLFWLCYAPAFGSDPGLEAYNRQDYATALKEWTVLAKAGSPSAQHNIATLYYQGLGTQKNLELAHFWYGKAAFQNYAPSAFSLGALYHRGEGVDRDYSIAGNWYEKATRGGHAKAGFFLGQLYERGEGVVANAGTAVKWTEFAAKKGDADGCFKMGVFSTKGFGQNPNEQKAVRWYQCAIEKGHNDARYNLALLYITAKTVPHNQIEAKKLFTLAGLAGHVRAQFNMGVFHVNGLDGQRDYPKGWAWLTIAHAGGHRGAAKDLKRLNEVMTDPQKVKAREELAKLKPRIIKPVKQQTLPVILPQLQLGERSVRGLGSPFNRATNRGLLVGRAFPSSSNHFHRVF